MSKTFEVCPKCGIKPIVVLSTITGEGYAACNCCKGELVKSIEPNQSERFLDLKKKALTAWEKKVRESV
jgi:formate dehydrogenase maturation protein FdhE